MDSGHLGTLLELASVKKRALEESDSAEVARTPPSLWEVCPVTVVTARTSPRLAEEETVVRLTSISYRVWYDSKCI